MQFQKKTVWMVCAALVALGMLGGGAVGYLWSTAWSGISGATAASWVQAVGSIAAIVVTYLAANRQFQHALDLQDRATAGLKRQRVEALGLMLSEIEDAVRTFRDAWIKPDKAPEDFAAVNGLDIPRLRHSAEVLKSLPLLDIPDLPLMHCVFRLPETLRSFCNEARASFDEADEPPGNREPFDHTRLTELTNRVIVESGLGRVWSGQIISDMEEAVIPKVPLTSVGG